MYEQLNFLHAFLDINPLTGEQRYPYLRFDDRGTPFSSNPAAWQPDPRDPGIRVGMTRQLIESGLRRQAIAAQWEVDTARIQQDIGDPNAGLGEEERAAKSGLGASYDTVTGKPVGQFRAVTLDLDGNGVISTVAEDAASNTSGCLDTFNGSSAEAQQARQSLLRDLNLADIDPQDVSSGFPGEQCHDTGAFARYQNKSCLRSIDMGCSPVSYINMPRGAINDCNWRKAA